METEPDDLRSSLESAFDDSTNEAPAAEPPVQEPDVASAEAAPAAEEREDRGDGRDAHGKFAPRAKPDEEKPAAVEAPPPQPVHDPYLRAPQSWKPGAREAWGQLPPQVREEVYRREREAHRVMHESAQARQVTQYVEQLQQQFAPALQAEGVDALTATQNLMNLASRLRFGTQAEKAQLAAQIIRNYGVDVVALDQVLSGQQPMQQQPPQMLQDPRVDQLMQQLNEAKQQRQQQVIGVATREVEGFGSGKEFFEDVREAMADLMEVSAKRGIDMSLEEAYERACVMSPDILRVLTARAQASAAGNSRQSTQRARHAASSVRGTPSGVSTPPATDLRGEIEAAIEQVGGR